jgi:hypothetical protein
MKFVNATQPHRKSGVAQGTCCVSFHVTAFYLSHRLTLCHPERSRGICSSADLSWKCFSTERSDLLLLLVLADASEKTLTGSWVVNNHGLDLKRRDRHRDLLSP